MVYYSYIHLLGLGRPGQLLLGEGVGPVLLVDTWGDILKTQELLDQYLDILAQLDPGKKRSRKQINSLCYLRRPLVAELYLKGHQGRMLTQVELAQLLQVGQATISRDMKAMEATWMERGQATISREKGRLLQELGLVKSAAWPDGRLGIVLDCIEEEAKILGAHGPKLIHHSGPDGGPMVHSLTGLSDEQLDRLITNIETAIRHGPDGKAGQDTAPE